MYPDNAAWLAELVKVFIKLPGINTKYLGKMARQDFNKISETNSHIFEGANKQVPENIPTNINKAFLNKMLMLAYENPVMFFETCEGPNADRVAAIKMVRQLTAWGLKEAKDYVDEYLAEELAK